jgi:hypothetical protein
MFSEEGFQAGAVRMAQSNMNITLTSVEDLRAAGRQDMADVALRAALSSAGTLMDRLRSMIVSERSSSNGHVISASPGVDLREHTFLLGTLSTLEHGVLHALRGAYPAMCGFADDDSRIVLHDAETVLRFAEMKLQLCSAMICSMEESAAQARPDQ